MTIVRTQRGADWLRGAADADAIQVRPGEEDPAAIALLVKLAARSRQRMLGAPGGLPRFPAPWGAPQGRS